MPDGDAFQYGVVVECLKDLRFEVLMIVSVKMAVVWVVVPYSLVEVYRSFRDACCLHHQGDE
jgi:hypothetical protein